MSRDLLSRTKAGETLSRAIFVGACVVWLFVAAVFGQRLPVKNYTTADGLANDFVGEIVRDSRGFLWFCTGEGLSRFDGYEFKNYTQAQGLPHRSVNDLLELENEIYLVATGDGIAVFNPHGVVKPQTGETPMFRTFRVSSESAEQTVVSVNDLRRTRTGEIWAATDIGLYKVLHNDGDDWRLKKIELDSWRGKSVEVHATEEDRFGRLWLGSVLGLFVFNPANGTVFRVSESPGWSLAADDEGRVWSGGAVDPSHAVHLFELPDADAPPVLKRHFTKADGLSDNQWIHALFKTSDGRILAGIRNGLNEFLPGAAENQAAFRQLFSADIVSLGEDAGGNLWVGTATRGAFKLTRHGFTLYQVTEKPPYGGVTSVFAGDAPDEIFVTSSENDLLRFDGEKFTEIQLQGFKSRSWSRNQLDFRSRIDGDWWFPTSAGLARYAAVEKFEDLARAAPKKIYRAPDGLRDDALFNLFEDSRGDVWIGSISAKDRLTQWKRGANEFRTYTSADGIPENSSPTAFAEDSNGNIWIGFYTGGAARLGRDGKFEFFSQREGFPSGYVSAIHADRGGRLWFATSNSGAVRVDNPTDDEPRFTNLNAANGLSSNLANCITEDNFGRIYIGTARGINRIEPETGRIKFFTQSDGLSGNSISRCTRDRSGNLWFTQKFNLARLDARADEKQSAPVTYIAGFRVNGEKTGGLSELGEATVEKLSLGTDQRQIQIDFFAVGFGTGETLRYQYKFEGADADWSEPLSQRTANLSLSPGKYVFLVRAVNAEGAVSENPARVSFSIARPFWQQWWFLLGASILSGLAIYFFYQYRLSQLVKIERVRTRIATDLHDDLGASLSKIAILSEIVNHEVAPVVKNPEVEKSLTEIAGTSREMIDSMADIVWVINPERDRLSDLIGRMRILSSEMSELYDIALKIDSSGVEQKDFILGADLRREIYMIFKETLNNIVKHANCDRVEIEFRLDADEFVLTVKDDGRGFEPETNGNIATRGGNGLINMKKRAANLKGSFQIQSETGTGTTCILRAPLKRKFSFFN